MRIWRSQQPARSAYACIRESARRRNLPFTISFKDFMEVVEGTKYIDEKGNDRYSLHLDRKDNRFGYEPGNLQVLTCAENGLKGNLERRKMYVGYFQQQKEQAELPIIPDGQDPF